MQEKYQRLREMILRQLDNNGISVKSKKAKDFEYAMMIGWLTGQSEETQKLDPYISVLCMSGRRLTEEKLEKEVMS